MKSDRPDVRLTGPYDSMRAYVAALEATGRLLRIKEMDQDQYEATGLPIAWSTNSASMVHRRSSSRK